MIEVLQEAKVTQEGYVKGAVKEAAALRVTHCVLWKNKSQARVVIKSSATNQRIWISSFRR